MSSLDAINGLFSALYLLILVRVVLSWVDRNPYSANPVKRLLYQVTEPLLEPIRQLIPPIAGAIDVSPLVAVVLLQVLQQLAIRLATR